MQYLELRPEQSLHMITPGRRFNSSCLQDATFPLSDTEYACIISINNAEDEATLRNSTEYFATAANYSDINQVYLSDGYAVLGPADPSSTIDFQAASFGSKTACQSVTSLCEAQNTYVQNFYYPSEKVYPSAFNFICNNSVAGLNMTGNFELTPWQCSVFGEHQLW